MTNEEAINVFKEWIERDKKIEYADRLENIEIYKMAIKALEQQPCEDAVSRKEVFETFGELLGVWGRRALMELPPVTLKPKTGYWIRVTDKTEHLVWKCDKCGWQQRFNTNFCPDCGADMRESEESE